jgi:protease II
MNNVEENVKSEPKVVGPLSEQEFYVENFDPQGFDLTRKMINEELENLSDDYKVSSPLTNEEWEWISTQEEGLNVLFNSKVTDMIWSKNLESETIGDFITDYFIPQVREGKDLKSKMVG